MECEFGLLDELEQSNILDQWHIEEIRQWNGPLHQAAQLLSILKQQNKGSLYQDFLAVLLTTQKHLVNFIRCDGGTVKAIMYIFCKTNALRA